MEKLFILVMDKLMRNKGYTLIDVLLSLFIMFLIATWFMTSLNFSYTSHVYALNYLQKQSEAMVLKEKIIYDQTVFNSLGNVNIAKTVIKNNYKYIINLGMGRLRYVK